MCCYKRFPTGFAAMLWLNENYIKLSASFYYNRCGWTVFKVFKKIFQLVFGEITKKSKTNITLIVIFEMNILNNFKEISKNELQFNNY